MKQFILVLIFLVQAIIAFAQAPNGLNLNDTAPDFSAKDQFDSSIHLKKLLENGPVVMVFYRGQWCPYCNRQLKDLEDSLSLITAKGATLVAITPETGIGIAKTVGKTKASYSILHDAQLAIMKSYKVAFAVDEQTVVKYRGYGIDLDKANGSNGSNLPVPAVYIIDKTGRITYKYFDTNYAKRPTVKVILEQL